MERRDLNRMFDALAPTAEQEQAVLDRLLRTERKGRPMRKLKKLTVLGIAAALMVISCAAAVVTGLDQRLLDYFGANQEQEPLMAPTAVRVEKSHTYENGWTVDIRQAMSDRYSMAVLIDVTAPEGTKLNGEGAYLKVQPSRKDGGYGYGCYDLMDETLPEDQASYLFILNYDDSRSDLIGSVWELTPESIYMEENGTEHEVALSGWTCAVSLSEQDPGILYEVGQPVSLGGHEATLDQLYLSPISFAFRLRHILSQLWDGELGLVSEDWEGQIVLHMDSGETVEMERLPLMGGLTNPDPEDPDAAYGHYQFRPERIIDPAEITAVTICGQTYELK
mgnify:FL=1